MRTTKPSQSSRIFSVGRWSTVLNIRNCSKDWTVSSFLMTEWPQFQITFRLIANWSRLVFNPIQQVVTEANITCRPAKILSWQMKNDKTNNMLTQNLGIENEPVHHRVCYSFCTKHTYTWRKTENTVRKTTHSPLKHRNTQGWLHANKQASASMDAHTHTYIHTHVNGYSTVQFGGLHAMSTTARVRPRLHMMNQIFQQTMRLNNYVHRQSIETDRLISLCAHMCVCIILCVCVRVHDREIKTDNL